MLARTTLMALALLMDVVPIGSQTLSVVTPDPRIQQIDARLAKAEAEGMNGAILIRRANQTLLHRAYGYRDREAGERLTLDHGVDIGSLVKPLTAAAIFKLQEAGRLTVQDTLAQHFDGVPPHKRSISIWHVLTHQAGFPDVFGGDYELVTREWLVERVLTTPLLAKPGERESYSNAGYSLLAALIERRSGQSYENYVRSAVLAPTRVTNVGYRLAGWTSANLAITYGRQGLRRGTALDQAWAADGPSWNLRGNGGMLATTQSLGQWFQALFAGRVIAGEALRQYKEIFVRPSRLTGGQSFGFAGGDEIFNAFQASYLDADVHFTFFTSDVRFQAELLWPEFRDQVASLPRSEPAAK